MKKIETLKTGVPASTHFSFKVKQMSRWIHFVTDHSILPLISFGLDFKHMFLTDTTYTWTKPLNQQWSKLLFLKLQLHRKLFFACKILCTFSWLNSVLIQSGNQYESPTHCLLEIIDKMKDWTKEFASIEVIYHRCSVCYFDFLREE